MQVVRRALVAFSPPFAGYQPLLTSWGIQVRADPTKAIGRSILMTGIYDLAVSEILVRLIKPGDTVIDAGSNVGYMTLLASVAAGRAGTVLSFEPHPELFAILEQNIAQARERFTLARTELHNIALGDRRGAASLVIPADFVDNDGTARIDAEHCTGDHTIAVTVDTLDRILGERSAAVLKLDVEGSEMQVLRGAMRALASGRVSHIVLEDHHVEGSAVVRLLEDLGYRLYSLGWAMDGISLLPVEFGRLATRYEAPSFVASIRPDELFERCSSSGWWVLDRDLPARS
jgi:FkbM family methyltransferase